MYRKITFSLCIFILIIFINFNHSYKPTYLEEVVAEHKFNIIKWEFKSLSLKLINLFKDYSINESDVIIYLDQQDSEIRSYEVGHLGNCSKTIGCATVVIPFAVDWDSYNYCDVANSNQITHVFSDNTSYFFGSAPFTINWDFGDGSISNGENPVHVYTTTGIYDIELIATDSLGYSDTKIKHDFINVVYEMGIETDFHSLLDSISAPTG